MAMAAPGPPRRGALLAALLLLAGAPARVAGLREDAEDGAALARGGGRARLASSARRGGASGALGARSFSALFGSEEQVAPALAGLFKEIDEKMTPMDPERWKKGDCPSMAKELLDAGGGPPREAVRLVHTGAFLKKRFSKSITEPARKLRLGILSFLSTQDLNRTKLRFWVDVPETHPLLSEILAPIKDHPDFKRSVSVQRFNAAREFGKLAPAQGKVLLQAYKKNTRQLPSRSDLLRAALLYNYGGVWIDGDVVMVQDFAPLFGNDWAYLGTGVCLINNALLSTSGPKSPFMGAYLVHAAAKPIRSQGNIFRYGPSLLIDLYKKVGGNGTFHVLPSCFFDGTWTKEPGAQPWWDHFFSRKAKKKEVDYLTPGNAGHTAFAYHWHNQWDKPMVRGSLGSELEQLYTARLGRLVV